jgi:hypothetical protein
MNRSKRGFEWQNVLQVVKTKAAPWLGRLVYM